MKYNITEIFHSIQGEGNRAGRPTIFIRMSGCSMGCSFCDTKYSWEKSKSMTVRQIVSSLSLYPCFHVTITGGEPFEQDMLPLYKELREEGFEVAYETNGSMPIPEQIADGAWITVSPKLRVLPENLRKANEVKFVIGNLSDMASARNMMYSCRPGVLIYLQPLSGSPSATKLCVSQIMMDQSLRLSVQLHKLINVR